MAFAIVLVVHGLIHLLGFAKAFELAELPQLIRPIPPIIGVVWLAATLLFLVAAGALFVWPRWWWAIGAIAIGVSMMAILPSWTDARVGACQPRRTYRRGARLPGQWAGQPAGGVRT